MRAALVCLSCFAAWGFGFCRTRRGSGRPPPRRAWRRPRYPQENLVLVRACASSPEISRGGHGVLPSYKGGAELPLPVFRRQAPRWARGWVGDPGARSRTPPTSAPFAKKVGSKT
jgi:hypothetical protein